MSILVHCCSTCKFSENMRPDPKVLQTVLVCKHGPPVFQLQFSNRGEMMPGFGPVPVPPSYKCGQYGEMDSAALNSDTVTGD